MITIIKVRSHDLVMVKNVLSRDHWSPVLLLLYGSPFGSWRDSISTVSSFFWILWLLFLKEKNSFWQGKGVSRRGVKEGRKRTKKKIQIFPPHVWYVWWIDWRWIDHTTTRSVHVRWSSEMSTRLGTRLTWFTNTTGQELTTHSTRPVTTGGDVALGREGSPQYHLWPPPLWSFSIHVIS